MEPMKQCPNCGKYVPADKTYCMSCGTTLALKCEACGKVLPLMTKVCPCGHSFVRKTKKVRHSVVLPLLRKHGRILLLGILAAFVLATVVLSAFPVLSYADARTEEITASGYSVAGYFFGGEPEGIRMLLGLSAFEDAVGLAGATLYLQGIGWLMVLLSTLLMALLVACNLRTFGQVTSRRLIPLLGVFVGGAAVIFGADRALWAVLSPLAAKNPLFGTFVPLTLLIMGAAVLGLHLFFYFLSVKGVGEQDALSVTAILWFPYDKLRAHLRKKRAVALGKEEDEKNITCTRRFRTYLILLGASLIFTQALLSKVSHIFFWFMFLLPVPCLLYTLIAKSTLTVTMISDTATTEKEQPYTYEFRIDNHSILAFPFIDAKVSIPQSNSVRCTNRSVRLSMAPMSSYHIKNTLRFRFRGTYEIGVRCFYVYDFFRMFRVKVPVENMTTVYVLPRRIHLEDTLAQAVSDSTVRTVKSPLVVDRLEVSDIRDYQNGDPLKSIHWKLSSKSETFVVKDYNTGTSNETVVFCDMAAHFPDEPPIVVEAPVVTKKPRKSKMSAEEKKAVRDEAKARKDSEKKKALQKRYRHAETSDTHDISDEALEARLAQRNKVADRKMQSSSRKAEKPVEAEEVAVDSARDVHSLAQPIYYEDMNEYLADGVVELTVASVLAELRQGHNVTLIWFDHRSESGVAAYALHGVEEFESIYHTFATAPLCPPDKRVSSLTAMISDIQSAKQLFVTSTLDSAMLSELTALPGVSDAGSFGSAEVILYNPEERFLYPMERASYLEGCRETLLVNGISLRTSGMIAVRREGGEVGES